MLESYEAVIDADGNIRTLVPAKLEPCRRAVVVLLEKDYLKQKQPPPRSNTIEVHFLHPRNGLALTADVSPQCTGAEALQELQVDNGNGAFLSPPQTGAFYGLALKRGNMAAVDITPNMTFAEAGVVDGDGIEIRLGGLGGGPGAVEVIQIVFASTALLLAFVKALTPIVLKLLESKFRIVVRDDTVEIEVYGIRSADRIIKMLEAIVKTKGLRLKKREEEPDAHGSRNVFSLQPAVREKDKASLKHRSRLSSAGKTSERSSGAGKKAARRKKSERKRPT
jgi:hypothetical protein